MRSISDTIARLSGLSGGIWDGDRDSDRLTSFKNFGSNPGALSARTFIPVELSKRAPLVVVLHGCTQSAAQYDEGSGWSTLAERHGFALLYPQQRRTNNMQLCFNWFEPGDIARGQGEALSISQMIETLCRMHDIDRSRVFISGLSAGGAMAAVMLATYPEVFAGGSILAGMPFGSAHSVPQAFDRMRGHGSPSDEALASLAERACSYTGRRPTISIWHGTADTTVAPSNVDHLVGQWHRLLGASTAPDHSEEKSNYSRRAWDRPDGTNALETVLIAGMGHGVAIDPHGPDGCGAPGPFMFDVGLSSTVWLARSWGLLPLQQSSPSREQSWTENHRSAAAPQSGDGSTSDQIPDSISAIIEKSLRAAGLMR